MTIKILDSWLREYLETNATPNEIAKCLSLTSLSVEKVEQHGKDYIYEIEITTNRPDLYSLLGIAREAAAILPRFGFDAKFIPLKLLEPDYFSQNNLLSVKNNPKLVNRICAVVLEVKVGKSPKEIAERLETSGIRSLNNLIDITNYVMRVVGHPTHIFDFDKLNTKEIIIKEGIKGERIETLDGKTHILNGGEIVATDEKGIIVDLLGVMGLENSAVNETTKRILYFIDNNDPRRIRNASMGLSIRTEAATLNEKGVDVELTKDALLYGIELFIKFAEGKQISNTIDIYPNKVKLKTVEVSIEKTNKILGIEMDPQDAVKNLSLLGFTTQLLKNSIRAQVPTFRLNDISIEEDLIEEIARIYGYHNLPAILPPTLEVKTAHPFIDEFYWEKRAKDALKYWGFTECYTYSFVSEEMYEGPIEEAVTILNPLTEELVYMRNTLIPSLLKVLNENRQDEAIRIFEIANIYLKKPQGLPKEILMLSGLIKKENVNFFELKGILEQLLTDLGIEDINFKKSDKTDIGSSLYIQKEYLGEIEVLDNNLADFELNFEIILKHCSVAKEFKPFAKYPPIIEDLSVIVSEDVRTVDLIKHIIFKSKRIADVSLKDSYKNTRTFHIVYQDPEKNLTKQDVSQIRQAIISSLETDYKAKIR